MNIAVISKASQFGGGASKVATDLVSVLKTNGHFVRHYRRDLEQGFTQESSCVYGKYEWIAKKTYFKLKYFGLQEIIPWEYFNLKNEIKKHKFDIIHFHDLTTAISPITLILLSRIIPVVWTLHDTSGFTGGCINPFGCEEFKKECKNCPQNGTWPLDGKYDLAFIYKKIKKVLHSKKNIYIISPSNWLAKEAYKSNIIKNKITIINNPININKFNSLDKNTMKENFYIDKKEFTILLAAGTVTSKTKGFEYALKILQSLDPKNFTLILVGKLNSEDISIFKKFKYIASGFTSNSEEINKYFSAADIFLNCSLGDNFPLVVLESLSSGTPVIGFNTGGIKEMIIQNTTGFLSDIYDTEILIKKIKEIMITKEYKNWSINAREYAINNYSEDIFLNNHINLYNKILER